MALGFLFPLIFVYLVADLLRRHGRGATGCRELIVLTAIVFGIFIVLGTELLNSAQALTISCVNFMWLLSCLAAAAIRRIAPRINPPAPSFKPLRYFLEIDWISKAMILAMIIFAAVLGLVALVATPNNFDSMTYHLARVGHWVQDQSISFYGTNNPRQNYMPPWAEWVMLQLTLLQGDDQLVNLVQWVSYLGCLIAASLVTELMGGTRRQGVIAAFFVATLPGATFEATSTQNDLVMSFWLLCMVYGCIKLTLQPGWPGSFIFGASLGLGLLTKTVVMIFAAPFCVWAVWALSRHGLRKNVSQLALASLLALGLNAGHCARNFSTSGNLLGPQEHDQVGSHYLNDTHSPGALFSNLLRNASLHANILHHKDGAETLVIKIHQALGLDPQDPRTTFNGGVYSIWEGGEDGAPMPFHLVVIGLSFVALMWKRRQLKQMPVALALSVLAGAFLFCFMLKWQPFHARLHLALFILAAPFAALALGGLFWRYFSFAVLALFLVTSVPNVFYYPPRPALGPNSVFVTPSDFQQLCRQPQLAGPFAMADKILDNYHVKEVGLIWKEDDWEYPLQTVQHVPMPWRLDHVLVKNCYAPLETTRVPDALLCTRPGLGESLTVHGQRYRLIGAYLTKPDKTLILSIYFPENIPFVPPQ